MIPGIKKDTNGQEHVSMFPELKLMMRRLRKGSDVLNDKKLKVIQDEAKNELKQQKMQMAINMAPSAMKPRKKKKKKNIITPIKIRSDSTSLDEMNGPPMEYYINRTPLWKRIWPKLQNEGWTWKPGSGLIDFFYIRPNKRDTVTDHSKRNTDWYGSPNEVIAGLNDIEIVRCNATPEVERKQRREKQKQELQLEKAESKRKINEQKRKEKEEIKRKKEKQKLKDKEEEERQRQEAIEEERQRQEELMPEEDDGLKDWSRNELQTELNKDQLRQCCKDRGLISIGK